MCVDVKCVSAFGYVQCVCVCCVLCMCVCVCVCVCVSVCVCMCACEVFHASESDPLPEGCDSAVRWKVSCSECHWIPLDTIGYHWKLCLPHS